MEQFKVKYTIKQADKGGLLVDKTAKFDTFINAVKYIRELNGKMAGQLVGKPLVERIGRIM